MATLQCSCSRRSRSEDPWLDILYLNRGRSASRSRSPRRIRSRSRSRSSSGSRFRSSRRYPTTATLAAAAAVDTSRQAGPTEESLFRSIVRMRIERLELPIIDVISNDPETAIWDALAQSFDCFYIGASTDPITRWCGCSILGIPGHKDKYTRMYLLAIETNKFRGRALEKRLIDFTQEHWPDSSRNRSTDARGQRPGVNAMYLCVKDDWSELA